MSLSDKVTQFNSDADIAHQVVHGDATTVVQTAGGPVRSLAKLVADNQASIDAQASLRADLAKPTGAAQVGTSDGSTVQAKLTALAGAGVGGSVKSVNQTAPDGTGDVELTTDIIGEGSTNKYLTGARVLAVALTGLSTATNAVIGVTDTVLTSMGKLQRQISDWIAAKDSSSGYPGLTLFKINFRNAANTFTSFLTNAATAARTYTFPDKDITVAGTTNETHVSPTIKGYIEQLQALNPAVSVTSVTLDPTVGTLIELSTLASLTLALPPSVAGMCYTLIVKYGGAHSLVFAGGTTLRWANGNVVPVSTSVSGKIDKYIFTCGTGYTLGQDGGRNF